MSRFRAVRLTLSLLLITALLVGLAPAYASAAPPPGKGKSTVYIVQMVQDPVVAYEGGIQGLQPTKPGKGQKINPNSAHVRRYAEFLEGQQNAALAAVGASAKIYSYRYSFNGFAAKLSPNQVAALKARPDVLRIWTDELRQLQTDNTPAFLGLTDPGTGLWAKGFTGENVIIGVIDTGIWPEHPSFSDQADLVYRPGNSGKRTRVYDAPQNWFGGCQSGEQFSQNACGNKLIGARYFKEGFTNFEINFSGDYLSARDADGHGTHTASTAGGNQNAQAAIYGIDRGKVSGMAPRARIAAYKACWADAGCATTDLTAAIDAAVADGVNVINYSIGSNVPDFTGPDDIAFLFAADAGVYVAASAGNAGPNPSTVGSPAASPWLTAVGANTHSRMFLSDITVYDASGTAVVIPTGAAWGASITAGIDKYRLLDAARFGDEACSQPFAPGTFAATDVVLCLRSATDGVARVQRVKNVAAGGGGAVMLYNAPELNDIATDNHLLPTVHMQNDKGKLIKDLLANNPGVTYLASFTPGTAVYASADPRVKAPLMASFSSRGPNGAAPDIIKPDITAPGLMILAGNTPTPFLGAPGQLFQSIQGTSMSSPHIAGIGALLVQAHRDWTPAMIKSAIMTTAYQDVTKGDGSVAANPFDMGAGHVAPNSAVDPGLVYNAGFRDYLAFLCGSSALVGPATCSALDGLGYSRDPSNLNLASIGIADLAGVQTIKRTVTNVGPAGTYNVAVDAPAGVNVAVNPASLTLATGESKAYEVIFTTQNGAAMGEWVFGSLTWSDGTHSVRSPLAIRPVTLSAPAEVRGTGVSGSLSFDIVFGYTGAYSAAPYGLVAADQQAGNVVDDPANDINTALVTGVGITEHTVSVPAGAAYLRVSLFDDYTDGADDLDLYVFGPGGSFVGGSGSGTSAEEVNVPSPAAGDYTVIVHGWQTDGPDANYTLFAWSVPTTAGGNMTLTAPAAATLGQTASVGVSWTGLNPATKYLGAVAHNTVTGTQLTIVRIDTDAAALKAGASGSTEGDNRIFLPALEE